MYSVADYVWMIADDTRVAAYAGAIAAAVRPGDRVLDVGAGFGFFSVIAARAGARRVDAVETNPAVHLGPRVAEANGCADRIVFHHLDATKLALDAPVDVIVSDLRGPTPFSGRSLEVLIDVRRRLLRPGGVMIPAEDTVFLAPVRVPDVVRCEVHDARGQGNVVLTPVERVLDDTPIRCAMGPADLLAPGRPWASIDYATMNSANVEGSVEWTFERRAIVHGLAAWFDTELGSGYRYSSAPGAPVRAYRQIYIPFSAPIEIAANDRLRVHLALKLVMTEYVWAWRAFVTRDGVGEREVLNQNSLAETVIDPSRLHLSVPATVPQLGPMGGALRALLDRTDGHTSVHELAAALRRDSPSVFQDEGTALAFVTEWIARISGLDRGTA